MDNSQIGTAGIFASQIIPTSSAFATFGGTLAYTFPTAGIVGPLAVSSGSAAIPALILGTAGTQNSTIRMFNAAGFAEMFSDSVSNVFGIKAAVVGFEASGTTNVAALDGAGNFAILGGLSPGGPTAGSAVSAVYSGAGAPLFSAPNGSLYMRYDGLSTGTTLYLNTSGGSTSGTTWTAITIP